MVDEPLTVKRSANSKRHNIIRNRLGMAVHKPVRLGIDA